MTVTTTAPENEVPRDLVRLVPMPSREQIEAVVPFFKREWSIADD